MSTFVGLRDITESSISDPETSFWLKEREIMGLDTPTTIKYQIPKFCDDFYCTGLILHANSSDYTS